MLNFYSFFKKKKGLSLVILFSIVAVMITVPQMAMAGLLDPIINLLVGGILLIYCWPIITVSMLGALITNAIFKGVLAFAFFGTTSYTHSYAVNIGWPIVRDLANMMIVLGFVVIGIATAIRFKEYEAKQLLSKLIIAAILVNFSLLICGIVIDGANILTTFFFEKIGDSSNWLPAGVDLGTLKTILTDVNSGLPKIIGVIVFNLIAILVYILYSLLVLCRVLALWILVILSPLAIVCSVFPASKNIWEMWKKNFLQWTIITIPAGLFYYIGFSMISKIPPAVPLSQIDWKAYFTNFISVALVPGVLLIIGFMVSLQFAPAGASAIMGAVKGKGAAAGKMLGKGVLDRTGASRLGAAARDKAVAAGEKMNLLPPNTGKNIQEAGLKESRERLKNMGEDRLAEIASQPASRLSQQQRKDKAVATELLAEKNALNKIDPNQRDSAFAHATSMGISKGKLTKSSPTMGTSATTDEDAREHIYDQRAEAMLRAGTKSSKKEAMAAARLTPTNSGDIAQAHKDIRTQKTMENSLGLSELKDEDVVRDLTAKKRQAWIDTGMSQVDVDKNMVGYKPSVLHVAQRKETLSDERVQKAVENLPQAKVSELPKEAMTPKVAQHFSTAQMASIYRNASPSDVTSFEQASREHIDKLMAGSAADIDRAMEYVTKMIEADRRASK